MGWKDKVILHDKKDKRDVNWLPDREPDFIITAKSNRVSNETFFHCWFDELKQGVFFFNDNEELCYGNEIYLNVIIDNELHYYSLPPLLDEDGKELKQSEHCIEDAHLDNKRIIQAYEKHTCDRIILGSQ